MRDVISPIITDILSKSRDNGPLTRDEALTLMKIELHSSEAYALMETANTLSRIRFGNKGELHFHIGLNVEPCPMDCRFCSLTQAAGIFKEKSTFPKSRS